MNNCKITLCIHVYMCCIRNLLCVRVECEMLSQLCHPQIVQFLGVHFNEGSPHSAVTTQKKMAWEWLIISLTVPSMSMGGGGGVITAQEDTPY